MPGLRLDGEVQYAVLYETGAQKRGLDWRYICG